MKRLIIMAMRESYGKDDVRTMTVRELRERWKNSTTTRK